MDPRGIGARVRNRIREIAFACMVAVVVAGCTRARTERLIDETFVIRPGELRGVMFVVDTTRMRGIVIEGSFSGREDNDIVAMLMEEGEFASWKQHLQASTIYTSAQRNRGAFHIAIRRSGRYYLVFSNHFSLFQNKRIRTRALLRYDKVLF